MNDESKKGTRSHALAWECRGLRQSDVPVVKQTGFVYVGEVSLLGMSKSAGLCIPTPEHGNEKIIRTDFQSIVVELISFNFLS
jgi:hypothetical protein